MFQEKEKGVSLIIVFFVMIVIIAVVISVSALLYSEIKVIRNISNSVASFYAADSGIEKVLYYDRNVTVANGTKKIRGMCAMCNQSNPSCPNNNSDASINCACSLSIIGDPIANSHGCDPDTCNDCTISFATTFSGINLSYQTKATVFPTSNPYDMEISSTGSFDNTNRAIDVLNTPANSNPLSGVTINNALFSPPVSGVGDTETFSADLSSVTGTISSVTILIEYMDLNNNLVPVTTLTSADNEVYCLLNCSLTPGTQSTWQATWQSSQAGNYYAVITATDSTPASKSQSMTLGDVNATLFFTVNQ